MNWKTTTTALLLALSAAGCRHVATDNRQPGPTPDQLQPAAAPAATETPAPVRAKTDVPEDTKEGSPTDEIKAPEAAEQKVEGEDNATSAGESEK